jgi:hypothetical protein
MDREEMGETPSKLENIGASPENPMILGNSSLRQSSDIDICPTSVSKFMAANGKKDHEVTSGKRKRSIPMKFKSPFALDKPKSRASRSARPGSNNTTRGCF